MTAAEFIARQRVQRVSRVKDIGQRGSTTWEIEAETYREQSNYPLKVFAFQRLRLVAINGEQVRPGMGARVGETEYRLGYYILSPTSGRWTWGQYNPMIPAQDFGPLLEQARVDGTVL